MAPSFDIGTPQRSLVRIPGSGQDKSLKPICLDVAQIKHFSVSLSTIVNFNFNAPPEQALGGTLTIAPVNSNSTQNTQERASNYNLGLGGQRGKDNQGGAGPSRKRSADEEQAQAAKRRLAASSSDSSILRNINLTLQERVQKMRELKEEEKKLREENEELCKKVAMFKDILRSRSKLKEFLQALEEMSC